MTVVYSLTAKNARLTAVQQTIDTAGPGWIRLLDASNNILSNVPLQNPSSSVASGVLTFLGVPLIDVSAALSGVPVSAIIADANNNTVVSGLTVGGIGSNADCIISPVDTIVSGQALAVTAATITAG